MHRVSQPKTGLNVDEVLEQIVQKIPAPQGDPKAPLQALIFDSVYDPTRVSSFSAVIKEGTVKKRHTDPHDGDRSRGRGRRSWLFRSRTVYPM